MADKQAKRLEARRRAKLKKGSMLEQAASLHDEMRKLRQADTGRDNLTFLQRPYARAEPAEAVRKAPVWFTAYMPSIIGKGSAGGSAPPLQTLGDPELWSCFAELGVRAVHTGPVLKAGGFYLDGTPYESIDGWFDPMTLAIDPTLGTGADYTELVRIANDTLRTPDDETSKLDGVVIGDIVPGHTGMGADFHLALQGADHYPGLFLLARVDQLLCRKDDCHHFLSDAQIEQLQSFPDSAGSHEFTRLLTEEEVDWLLTAHVIPGKPQRAMGTQAGFGWSITREVEGVPDENGNTCRRWVYLHFFHPKQPTLNFFDPGYAAWRLINGQLNYMVWQLRSTGVRLDANAFLGIERAAGPDTGTQTQADMPIRPQTWSEAHPLSDTVTNMLAWQARRLGGFSFEEKNMAVAEIAKSGQYGPDLTYDFITRPAVEHAMLTGDTALLAYMYRAMTAHGINPGSLVHALQNHDEITYELIHLGSARDDHARGGTAEVFRDSPEQVRADMRRVALGREGDSAQQLRERTFPDFYNMESGNGLCTTMAGLLAARLHCANAAEAAAKLGLIRQGHLLLAAFNALQPGVFALSGWDLVGAMPVGRASIPAALLNAGAVEKADREKDFRWVNRGAYRLLTSFDDHGRRGAYGVFALPEAHALYGTLDTQRTDEQSFFHGLKHILRLREELGLATARFVRHVELGAGVLGLALELQESKSGAALAVFNFNPPGAAAATLDLSQVMAEHWPELEVKWAQAALAASPGAALTEASHAALQSVEVLPWNWFCLHIAR